MCATRWTSCGWRCSTGTSSPYRTTSCLLRARSCSGRAGSDGMLLLNLHAPKAKGEALDADVPDSFGQVKIRFYYNYSVTANTHAATDVTVEKEELAYIKLIDVTGRFSAHLGYLCNPMWYWLETCMWVRPFESAFWCLIIFCSVFVFDNLISAWFPGLMFIAFVKKYAENVKAAGRTKVEEEVPPFDWRECARTTQVNLAYYCDMLDWWHEYVALHPTLQPQGVCLGQARHCDDAY
eukprot:TRINITY_DN9644_c0_g1_i1.p1 TRINITY_DN9644_c0_g1~~TRINITY_DN9644_c0_g1_i1.p1  ORF type:complete len:237 (-),score=59.83 TRINITY_DN9644_c0_g1_i1:57-767(-)